MTKQEQQKADLETLAEFQREFEKLLARFPQVNVYGVEGNDVIAVINRGFADSNWVYLVD